MKLSLSAAVALLAAATSAQTHTDCNPTEKSCPAKPGLGGSVSYDFTKGAPEGFKVQGGAPKYDGNGASFVIAKKGDAPTIISDYYIMFGRVEAVMKASPGKGIVSSFMLQSDALDELDWEFIGGDNNQVQSNYFGQSRVVTYGRVGFHPAPANHDTFHTYTFDWTASKMSWIIDGNVVREITPENAIGGQYPQTPMHVRIGPWAAGDPDLNSPGTVEWAGGPTDYSQGPFSMVVKSLKVTDYSTGKQYRYTDRSGKWQSIEAIGGKVNPGGSGAPPPEVESSTRAPPKPTTTPTSSKGMPSETPSPDASTTIKTVSPTLTSLSGLPSSWIITEETTGRATTPSTAAETSQSSSPSSRSSSDSSDDGSEPTTDGGSNPQPTSSGFVTSPVPTGEPSAPAEAPPSAAVSQSSIHYGLVAICAFVGWVALV
ncbi:hypothetical protein FQN57_000561 [Myotisia sp. PD_48]|nr:hypothetical protein FQN57_000561 [Myotisia sp. PD_48]